MVACAAASPPCRRPRRPWAPAGAAFGARLPGAPNCPVFPARNPWNQRVDTLPVAADSKTIVSSIGANGHLHADFGSGLWDGSPIGIPVTVVGSATPRAKVSFDYANESDAGPYPIPANVKIEGGGDAHAILVDSGACKLYELYALTRTPERRLACRLGRDLEPRLEPAAARRLDLGRRGRSADPPRSRALRRRRSRPHRPCSPLHGLAHAARATSGRRATSPAR